HPRGLVDLHAMLGGVFKHHDVELAAADLPGLRAFVWLVVMKVERGRMLPRWTDELDAVLPDEVTRLQLVEHPQPLEDPVGLWNQRLADVIARIRLPLEQFDAVTLLSDEGRDGGTGRAAADDDDIGSVCLRHGRVPLQNGRTIAGYVDESFVDERRVVGVFVRSPGLFQQPGQLPQRFRVEMTELTAMALQDRLVDVIQQLQSLGCDLHLDDATIPGTPLPAQKTALFEPVQQAGHVGSPGDQPAP